MKTFLSIFFFALSCIPGVALEVEGDISYVNSHSKTFSKKFHVFVKEPEWTISTWYDGGLRGTNITFFDGTNIYKVVRFVEGGVRSFPPGVDVAKKAPSGQISKNQATATVLPGPIPEGDSSFVAPLWLAYASRPVLTNTDNRSFLTPPWPTIPSLAGTPIEVVWSRGTSGPLDYISYLRFGQTQGVYRVVDSFQTSGGSIPRVAVLEQHAKGKVFTLTKIEARQVMREEKAVSVTSIPRRTIIVDRRLGFTNKEGSRNYFSYFSSNGVVHDPNNLKQGVDYQRAALMNKYGVVHTQRQTHNIRFLLLAAFALISSFFILVMIKSRNAK